MTWKPCDADVEKAAKYQTGDDDEDQGQDLHSFLRQYSFLRKDGAHAVNWRYDGYR